MAHGRPGFDSHGESINSTHCGSLTLHSASHLRFVYCLTKCDPPTPNTHTFVMKMFNEMSALWIIWNNTDLDQRRGKHSFMSINYERPDAIFVCVCVCSCLLYVWVFVRI